MKNFKIKNARLLTLILVAGISFASPINTYAEEGEILYVQEEDEHVEEELTEETKEEMIKAEENAAIGTGTGTGVGTIIGEGAGAATGTGTGAGTGATTGAEGAKKEYGEDEFIDATNWSPAQDVDPNAGKEIPDSVKTEAERKGIGHPDKPKTPDTPPDTTPKNPENPSTPSESQPQTPITPETPQVPAPKTGESDMSYYLKYIKTGIGVFGIGALLAIIADMIKKGKAYTNFLKEQEELEIEEEPKRVIKSRRKKQRKSKIKSLRRN